MSSSPPTTLGQYQIIREIARSNDIVYEAYDPLMNRRVAVKELSMPHGMTDAQKQDRISRFKREAQAAGTLNHPNIMTVHSFAEDAGRTFMAMEFLDGNTLRNEIDTKGFIPVDRAVEIAIAVLEGLGHAHSKGVIHRDIKPDNVQILSTGAVKITDFGIARLTFQPNLTMDGQVFGTPSYMSPEQVVGRDIDARSDLFSVAVVLYEMLSGQKPFAGDSVVSITYAIMNKEPQQPTQCDWGMWQVLNRSLDKSPQLRYGGATEMIEALKTARKQAQSGLMAGTPPPNSGFNPNHPNNTPGAYTSPYANPSAGYAPLNPGQAAGYGAPPPAQGNYNQPQAYGPGTYNQQPYNPYQAPAVAPPPPQYPYNPYQQAAPQPSYGMPPPTPLPIYYPPPPRAPLLKPDTVVFLKKLAVAFVILGTLFAIVIVGMSSLARALQNTNSRGEDARVALQIKALSPRVPLDERIDEARRLMNRLPANDRSAAASATADLMAQYAKSEMQKNPGTEVETYLYDLTMLDPNNANHHALQGQFYLEKARSATNDSKVNLLRQAGDSFYEAGRFASGAANQRYNQQAAEAFFAAAETLLRADPEQRSTIRDLLNSARTSAPSGSPIIPRIDDALQWVRSQAGG